MDTRRERPGVGVGLARRVDGTFLADRRFVVKRRRGSNTD
jgi:hypothetical protein